MLAVSLDPEGLLDGKWCKIPEALFDELLTALQNEEERIQPTRQELVYYGQTVADNLEKFLIAYPFFNGLFYNFIVVLTESFYFQSFDIFYERWT